jgi:TonB family protein
MTLFVIRFGLSIASALLLLTARVSTQETLAGARELYSAAAYEDALRVLDRLEKSDSKPGDRLAIHQYRAFCLLALGRTTDAERAIEAVVSSQPFYHPSDAEVSPRLRSAFSAVRQRMLPAIVQQKYAQAKSAYDQKDFVSAAAGFGQVLDALADPDIGPAASRAPLSDLGTLAVGFRELSLRAAMPTSAVPAPREAPGAAPKLAAVTIASRIYHSGDSSVVPPVALLQELPRFTRNIGIMRSGVLEVVINEAGLVEAATLRSSINPRYDVLALEAARFWRYKPATLHGTPVKFRKTIVVAIKQGS